MRLQEKVNKIADFIANKMDRQEIEDELLYLLEILYESKQGESDLMHNRINDDYGTILEHIKENNK